MPRVSNHEACICDRDSKPVGPRLARDVFRLKRQDHFSLAPLAGRGRIATSDAKHRPEQSG